MKHTDTHNHVCAFRMSPHWHYCAHLQVDQVISSYSTHSLLKVHVPGTREWLVNAANDWLGQATAVEHAASIHNRMFLLLADPGMVRPRF